MREMYKIALLIVCCFSVIACTAQSKNVTTKNVSKFKKNVFYRKLPYPQSKFISKLVWTSEPYRYPGSGSDMHWWTWGIDDAIYTVDDDGKNFGGKDWYAHVLKITGIPPNHKVATATDFEGYDFRATIPKKLLRRYVCGITAIDSNIYVCLYDYDWNVPSKPVSFDSLYSRIKEYNPWHDLDSTLGTNMGFIDAFSKLGGVAGIIKSNDFGKTWTNIPGETTPAFFGSKFGAPAFLTFGKGNTETPKELGPYVYAISNDGSWETGDNVRMGRVHRDSILTRNAWHFFAGLNSSKQPKWIADENESNPIFTDIDHVGHPTITYNKALKRYFLLIYSDVYPHKENATIKEFKQWDYESELQMYESINPWGPWFVFHAEKPWGGKEHSAYLGQIPSKWISNNGLSGTIIFAGDYVHRKGEYYGFMTQAFKLFLK